MEEILYHIYAGLGGGFGGAHFVEAEYFKTTDAAFEYAYERAVEDYQSYEGCHGLLSWGEIAEDNDLDPEEDSDEIDDLYREEIESWTDYYAVRADEDGEILGALTLDEGIDEFDGDYAFLSNFYECPVMYRGRLFNSAESAYQAQKTMVKAERDAIQAAATPKEAKKLGRKCTMRYDWEDVKINEMKAIVKAKFDQNPALKTMLLDTKNKILIEGNYWGDNFWGICWKDTIRNALGEKHNVLGVILYELRDAYRYE